MVCGFFLSSLGYLFASSSPASHYWGLMAKCSSNVGALDVPGSPACASTTSSSFL
jgi:hypothetical protein